VLQSVYNSRERFLVFVANRLAEIERHSDPRKWRYVPTKLNPADETTRGMTVQRFLASAAWISGPEFLFKSREEWPEQLEKLPELLDDFPMFERRVQPIPALLLAEPPAELPMDRLIKSFSSLCRLKKAVVWLKRFVQ